MLQQHLLILINIHFYYNIYFFSTLVIFSHERCTFSKLLVQISKLITLVTLLVNLSKLKLYRISVHTTIVSKHRIIAICDQNIWFKNRNNSRPMIFFQFSTFNNQSIHQQTMCNTCFKSPLLVNYRCFSNTDYSCYKIHSHYLIYVTDIKSIMSV